MYQDNMSVILLVTIRGGTIRTKHMHKQMNLALEVVTEKRIKVSYIHKSKMLALPNH